MPRLVAVFDTNIYRQLGDEAFAAVTGAEGQHSVLGYANYATATELLAHLASPESIDGRSAAAAARRLVRHCTHYDGATNLVRFIASPAGQISRYLFGIGPAQEDDAEGYGHVLGRWVTDPESRPHFRETLERIARDAEETRQKYTATLWNTVVLTLCPDASKWQDVVHSAPSRTSVLEAIRRGDGKRPLALSIAREAARNAGRVIALAEEDAVVAAMLASFGLIIEYRNLVIEQLITDGADMGRRRRANGVFDLHVCGATAGHARLHGCPVVLVTDDTAILTAAERALMKEEVLTLEEYRALVISEADLFVERVRELLDRQRLRGVR